METLKHEVRPGAESPTPTVSLQAFGMLFGLHLDHLIKV